MAKVNYSVVENEESRTRRSVLRSSRFTVAESSPGPAPPCFFASGRHCQSKEVFYEEPGPRIQSLTQQFRQSQTSN